MNELLKHKKGCVYFHQGWTDIIICMGLINHYAKLYDDLYVIIRSDAKELVDFYTRGLNNVNVVYIDTDNGRFYGQINTNANCNTVFYENGIINIGPDFEILFHAEHDRFRRDHYQNYWYRPNHLKKSAKHFSEMFYTFYDIDFSERINSFDVIRDSELENNKFSEFIEKHGENYVIYHDDQMNHQHGSLHVSTQIDFEHKDPNYSYVNLNKCSQVFFDFIKIIQNAKEIHLVDSIWACLLYQLDAKYSLFNNKIINVYCKRGHYALFQYPITLENWILK